MSGISLKKRFSSIKTHTDIKHFVIEGTSEDVWLDFKEASSPTGKFDKDDRKNYSKALSGFANEDGGIIVWGIKCKRNQLGEDVATELKLVPNVKAFLSELNTLANQATDPPLGGIQNKSILTYNKNNSGFIVTYVPRGVDCPYKATMDGHVFYGRSGSGFYLLATHQIRRLMMLTSNPDLDVEYRFMKAGQSGGPNGDRFNVDVTVVLRNKGNSVATHPYVHVVGPNGFNTSSVYEYSRSKLLERAPSGAYVGGADIACYPNIDLEVTRTKFEINPKAVAPSNKVFEYQVSFTAMNCPLKEKKFHVTQEEICKVWEQKLCCIGPR